MYNRRTATDYVIYVLAFLVVALGGVGLYDMVHPIHVGTVHAGQIGVNAPGRIFHPWAGRTRVRMLILGVDERDRDTGRSDTVMLATINPETKQAALLSFPRDMWVYVPGHGQDKINHAYKYGGVQLSKETVEQLLGLSVDHYARMDFAGFKDIVDVLGGVEMDVEMPMHWDDRRGNLHIHLSPGMQHLDGEQAMGYVRYRLDSDYQRIKRQQHFMRALMEQKLKAKNIPRLLRVLPRIADMLETDMSERELFALFNLLREMEPSAIRGATVPVRDGEGSPYRSYLLPAEYDELMTYLAEHLDSEAAAAGKVELRNGSGVEGAAADAARRLDAKGFQITRADNWESFGHRSTEVRFKPGALHAAEWVTEILECGEAVRETDSLEYYERNAPLRVVIGSDYEPLPPAPIEAESDAAEGGVGRGHT